MAKKRRHRTGSVITTRRLSGSGLGKLDQPGSALGAVLPPLLGGGLAALGAFGISHLATPEAGAMQSSTQQFLQKNAEWLGIAVGGLGALAMYTLVGAPQGLGAMAGAIGVGGALGTAKVMSQSPTVAGRYRMRARMMGAIVPQLSPTGAIVMAPAPMQGLGNSYQARGPSAGEVVSLGAVNPGAFGTPGFTMGVR